MNEMQAWKEGGLSPKQAIEIQRKLRPMVDTSPFGKIPKIIAGADVSLERFGTDLYAGIIVMSYPDLVPIEYAVSKIKVEFPYIPGLLSFREIPGLLDCLRKLKNVPDLVVVDGQGIAHPRRLGIATHLGIVSGIPTIGCAKSNLYGSYDAPMETGVASMMLDPKTLEHIGFALKSKKRANPLIVSPGNKISVGESLDIVRKCLRGYRLPEPTRLAHELVNRFRKGEIEE